MKAFIRIISVILLTLGLFIKDGSRNLPDYYIEKSDLGSGEISLHEYHYRELDLSFGF